MLVTDINRITKLSVNTILVSSEFIDIPSHLLFNFMTRHVINLRETWK